MTLSHKNPSGERQAEGVGDERQELDLLLDELRQGRGAAVAESLI